MAILSIEGQEYPLDDAIANGGATDAESDQLLRDALRPTFEIAAGATFVRAQRDGQLHITLVKHPGPKGSARVLQHLIEAPEWVNPIVELARQMHFVEAHGALTIEVVASLRERIETVLVQGRAEEAQIARALTILRGAPAVVATDVPPGL